MKPINPKILSEKIHLIENESYYKVQDILEDDGFNFENDELKECIDKIDFGICINCTKVKPKDVLNWDVKDKIENINNVPMQAGIVSYEYHKCKVDCDKYTLSDYLSDSMPPAKYWDYNNPDHYTWEKIPGEAEIATNFYDIDAVLAPINNPKTYIVFDCPDCYVEPGSDDDYDGRKRNRIIKKLSESEMKPFKEHIMQIECPSTWGCLKDDGFWVRYELETMGFGDDWEITFLEYKKLKPE
mgnify:CR=1 FL=1